MKGSIRVCAEGGKIKKRTRTKSETENWRGGGRGGMFGAGPPLPPHPPKFRIVWRFFFQIVFIHSFIFFLYLSMSLGLWFSIWPFLDTVSPHRPPARSTPFFPKPLATPSKYRESIQSRPYLAGSLSLSLSLFPNSPKPSL